MCILSFQNVYFSYIKVQVGTLRGLDKIGRNETNNCKLH